MKKLSFALAALIGLAVLAPTTAEAGHRTRVTVDRCGYTIYSEYRFVGRDCDGCPIFRWVVTHREPPCRSHDDDYGYRSGSGHGSGHGSGWSRGRSHSRTRCGTGITFHMGR